MERAQSYWFFSIWTMRSICLANSSVGRTSQPTAWVPAIAANRFITAIILFWSTWPGKLNHSREKQSQMVVAMSWSDLLIDWFFNRIELIRYVHNCCVSIRQFFFSFSFIAIYSISFDTPEISSTLDWAPRQSRTTKTPKNPIAKCKIEFKVLCRCSVGKILQYTKLNGDYFIACNNYYKATVYYRNKMYVYKFYTNPVSEWASNTCARSCLWVAGCACSCLCVWMCACGDRWIHANIVRIHRWKHMKYTEK